MKVKGLIDNLKALPAEAQVLVQGYEDGYDSVISVRKLTVISNPAAEDWNGEYEEAEKAGKGVISAVVILGNRR